MHYDDLGRVFNKGLPYLLTYIVRKRLIGKIRNNFQAQNNSEGREAFRGKTKST